MRAHMSLQKMLQAITETAAHMAHSPYGIDSGLLYRLRWFRVDLGPLFESQIDCEIVECERRFLLAGRYWIGNPIETAWLLVREIDKHAQLTQMAPTGGTGRHLEKLLQFAVQINHCKALDSEYKLASVMNVRIGLSLRAVGIEWQPFETSAIELSFPREIKSWRANEYARCMYSEYPFPEWIGVMVDEEVVFQHYRTLHAELLPLTWKFFRCTYA
jgi:hypothetical protein